MKHMHIEKKIKNHEEKGKSFISFLLNSAHNGTRNITKFGDAALKGVILPLQAASGGSAAKVPIVNIVARLSAGATLASLDQEVRQLHNDTASATNRNRGGIVCGQFLASELYDTASADPGSLGASAAVLLVVASLACLVPALRSKRVQP